MLFRNKKSSDDDGGVATVERAHAPVAIEGVAPQAATSDKKKKKDDEELEYEWEFETPFGKLEFELDPKARHEEKERLRREKAEREEAKKAARAAKKSERQAIKMGLRDVDVAAAAAGQIVIVRRSNWLPVLLVFALVAAAVIVAVWLFARPGDDDTDVVPEEFRADGAPAAAPPPQGIAGRLKQAIRAGKKASREAQAEQQRRFEETTNR
jgi:hypothetical protein